MSIERFKNKDVILATNKAITATTLDPKDDTLLVHVTNKPLTLPDDAAIELHAYTQDGLYIGGLHELSTTLPVQGTRTKELSPNSQLSTLNLKFDILEAFRKLSLERGTYKFALAAYKPVVGSYYTQPFYIEEDGISPDRTEIKLVLRADAISKRTVLERNTARLSRALTTEINTFKSYDAIKRAKSSTLDDLVLNFGNNNVYKILNLKFAQLQNFGEGYYIKLYEPLPTFIDEKDLCWIAQTISDTYLDTITIIGEAARSSYRTLRGANFNFDVNGFQNTETTLQSWNDLLATNTITAQTVIDRYFSGSITETDLPIDYSAFDNFVFYGSAAERVQNFKYKVELTEYYDTQIAFISSSQAASSSYAINNIELNQKRKDALIGTFDGFERWMYNDSTASLFTHAISGSTTGAQPYVVTTYPKYISQGNYKLHPSTSSIVNAWYNGLVASASLFDEQNGNSLVNHIPEYIRMDEANAEFSTFVYMIGQHYDTLWTYINALTKIRSRDEHPKLGIPKQLVYSIAEQYGVKLINGRQSADLWKYKLGVNTSGSYQTTGSLLSKPEEDLVTDVWRRVVNNMPYLLKTKGTARSIKALLNTYGIPQTLISIREYGGPALEGKEEASLTQDFYAYALSLTGSSYVRLPRTYVSSSLGDTRPVDTIEFRLRPSVTSSMSVLAHSNATATDINWNLTLEHTASYSGSGNYGRLTFKMAGVSGSTSYAPLFDGDYWNVRLSSLAPITSSTATSSIKLSVQKASDFVKGNIIWDVSSDIVFNSSAALVNAWSITSSGNYLYLGGLTGSTGATAARTFIGNVQGYKEYMEIINDTVYDYHTYNPASYRGNDPTSSFYTLIRYLPLGLDNKTYNHSTALIVSSSHPSKDKPDYSATWGRNYTPDGEAFNFVASSDGDNYASIVETYYIYGTSVAGLNSRAEKIRLEDNYLIRDLDPTTSAERSRFDTAPLDSNKLSIVFSPQEQINKDIFNQVGYVNLNNYIAQPLLEYESEYADLKRVSREYFRKYKNRTDTNEFVRAFSLYDFSIFEMLKQFVPMRANLSTGLLVEPHVLERSKVALLKRPSIENPQYEVVIDSTQPTASGDYNLLDTVVTGSTLIIDSETIGTDANLYVLSSSYQFDDTETIGNDAILSGSFQNVESESDLMYDAFILDDIFSNIGVDDITGTDDNIAYLTSSTYGYEAAIYKHINLIPSTSIQTVPGSITTASFLGTGLVSPGGAATWLWNSDFQLYYSGVSGSGETEVGGKYDANKDSTQYSRFIFTYDDGINLTPSGSIQSYRLYVYHIETDNWFVTSSVSLATLQGGIQVNLTGQTLTRLDTDLLTSGFVATSDPTGNTNTIIWTQPYPVKRLTWITSSISPLEYSPTGSIIDTARKSYHYKKVIYHYGTGSISASKRTKYYNLAVSESVNNYYSRSLAIADYNDDESTALSNLRYEGCKLTSPDYNTPSLQLRDGSPVIEVYETNANRIIRQDSPNGTDLIIE
jgi:hypothetical protein